MSWAYWGEANNPVYAGTVWRTLNPHLITLHNAHPLREKTVQAYMRNPNRTPDDGDVVVVKTGNRYRCQNGNHRIEAARRTNRKITCRVRSS